MVAKVKVISNEIVKVSVQVAVQTGGHLQPYEGDYDVIPLVHNPIVLQTDGFRMTDDVTVQKIPQYEVSNISGGKTLIIGNDYE